MKFIFQNKFMRKVASCVSTLDAWLWRKCWGFKKRK